MNKSVEFFTASDGDSWWSVLVDGELATGEMHVTREAAEAELATL